MRLALLHAVLPLLLVLSGCGGGGPSTSCVAAGTLVETPAGLIRIEQLELGDEIYSVDPRTGRREASAITQVRTATRACLQVTTLSGRTIRATADHPFYCARTGRYVELSALLTQAQAALASVADDGSVSLDLVVDSTSVADKLAVYDLTVASPLHNFVAAGILVHNKSDPTLRLIDQMATFSDDATGAIGEQSYDEAPAVDPTSPPAMVSRSAFVDGVGTITLERSTPFDRVHIGASGIAVVTFQEDGVPFPTVVIVIDPPATSVVLNLEFEPRVQLLNLSVVPVSSGMAGSDVPSVTVPRDG